MIFHRRSNSLCVPARDPSLLADPDEKAKTDIRPSDVRDALDLAGRRRRHRATGIEPLMAVDPLVGPARDLGHVGAALAPAAAEARELVEAALPFLAENAFK